MSKPDPEQFARVVLWHLAGLRADVLSLETHLAEMRGLRIAVTSEELRTKLKHETRDRLYFEALREVGIKASTEPPNPPSTETQPE